MCENWRMKEVYLAADPVQANMIKDWLGQHNISAQVFGEFGWGARGELAADGYPRVVLNDERDYELARGLIAEFEKPNPMAAAWNCPSCNEHVDAEFALCWNCGTKHADA